MIDAKEMQSGEDSDGLNKKKNLMIGLTPATTIEWKIVELKQKYPPEYVLPEDGLYHYLYQHGETHGNQRQRATDLKWSKEMF